MLALAAAHSPPVTADGSIGHRVAGAAGWAGDDHLLNCNSLRSSAHKGKHPRAGDFSGFFHIVSDFSALFVTSVRCSPSPGLAALIGARNE
jgi:hypothetical protein